jgi:hypothetical protein
VGISFSSLSITQRTLTSRTPPTARAEDARALATKLITQQGSHHVVREVHSFLSSVCNTEIAGDGRFVSLTANTSSRQQVELPTAPYGLKGGAARELVVAALGVRGPRKPRDLDLIRKGHFPITDDDAMAQRFMSRDYANGARVELIRDMQRYLNSRDITLNEVASFESSVTLSLLAALDSIGHVIRPSQYRGGSIHRKPSLDGRILLKMARLFAEAEHFKEPALIVGIPDGVSFTEFDLAIQLNKAFQQGTSIARGFIDVLVLLGALEASIDPLQDTLDELSHLRHGERGLFPDVPAEFFSSDFQGDND